MSGKSGRWLCAAVAAIATVTATAAAAHAETAPEGKRLVILGDSFTANGLDLLAGEDTCVRGQTSWPAQLSRLMGLQGADQWANPSCQGAAIDTGRRYTLSYEARLASQSGAFGPHTELVTIQFGLNDRWGKSEQTLWDAAQQCIFDLAEGCGSDAVGAGRIPDAREISGTEYAARIRSVVTYIRYYAPAARIVLVGYPEVFGADQDGVCLNFFGLVPFTQPRGRTLIDYFHGIDQAQREAAAELKVDYLDARALTAGHGSCSAQPWVNGVWDPSIDFNGLPFHPSPKGDAVVANALYERYVR